MGKLTESKWLPIVVAAIIGIGLLFLLLHAFSSAIGSATTIGGLLGIILGIAAACYFVAGLIAGAWTRRKGAGVSAAIVVMVANLVINIARGFLAGFGGGLFNIARGSLAGFGGLFMAILILLLLAAGIGFLGGSVGARIRR